MIIIDIDMPKCCAYCPIYDKTRNMCNAIREYLFTHEFWENRYKNCPLKEYWSESPYYITKEIN